MPGRRPQRYAHGVANCYLVGAGVPTESGRGGAQKRGDVCRNHICPQRHLKHCARHVASAVGLARRRCHPPLVIARRGQALLDYRRAQPATGHNPDSGEQPGGDTGRPQEASQGATAHTDRTEPTGGYESRNGSAEAIVGKHQLEDAHRANTGPSYATSDAHTKWAH